MRDIKYLALLRAFALCSSLLITSNHVFAQTGVNKQIENEESESNQDFDLKKLVLPSEVKNIGKAAGALYYSPSIKGKVLIPVHFWGYFNRPGLHFVPVNSTLLEGVSYAGGPNGAAKIDNVRLMRKDKAGSVVNSFYDLEKGGSNEAALRSLRPGDMVFVEKDNWRENRSYYTSLIGVLATILSSILIFRQVKKNE